MTMARAGMMLSALLGSTLALAADSSTERSQLYVTRIASALVDRGLAASSPKGSEATAFVKVPHPGVQFRANQAHATTTPWVDSNAWRFERGVKKANYSKLPAGAASLAAAEAFAFRVDAILDPNPADVDELGKVLEFLKAQDQPALPVMANIDVVDDESPMMGEVLNLLTRRNLLYRVVSKPDPQREMTVQLGTSDFPKQSAANPSDFAARVRNKLGDDKRLVRLYGTNTVIAHLTGDGKRTRLVLLSYSRNRTQPGVRVRLLNAYVPAKFVAYGTGSAAQLLDIEGSGSAVEFSVPPFSTIAIIDLETP